MYFGLNGKIGGNGTVFFVVLKISLGIDRLCVCISLKGIGECAELGAVLGQHQHRPMIFAVEFGCIGVAVFGPATAFGRINNKIGAVVGIFDDDFLVGDGGCAAIDLDGGFVGTVFLVVEEGHPHTNGGLESMPATFPLDGNQPVAVVRNVGGAVIERCNPGCDGFDVGDDTPRNVGGDQAGIHRFEGEWVVE